jgi:photosystem II stability/assembly factor-like uncharacterized protein
MMFIMRIAIIFFLCFGYCCATAQSVQLINIGNKVSIRGLSVVNDKTIWVTGSNGSVARSIDSGKTWKWMTIKGFEKRDFRDIEAFDEVTAIVMAIAEPALILKTVNGGDDWRVVYENNTPGMFLDAMEFWNEQSGIVMGDPINGRFFIARTFDEGSNWQPLPFDKLPVADTGEAAFASSGTNIRSLDKDEACFISGGLKSRFFWKGTPIQLPVLQGKESAGANSIAVRDNKKRKNSEYFVVVGGDFSNDTSSYQNCALTKNGGKTWQAPKIPPKGYRSCVEFINKNKLITCGTSGVDISSDGGMRWQYISRESYHVCRKSKKGKSVFLAGPNGKIGKLIW